VAIRDLVPLDSTEMSIVQNRVAIAGLSLTALVFSGSFSLSLFGLVRGPNPSDYRDEFVAVQTSLALGVITSLMAIASFLLCQQIRGPDFRWYASRQWWFAVGQTFLYMTLAQAMSAALPEVVYGIWRSHRVVAVTIGVAAMPAWRILFFGAPVLLIRQCPPFSP
jgi:hypothetical protein